MKEKKLKKSEVTKSYIYDGAIALFAKNGYEKTTIRGLAKELNLSLGNLYYYFKSKDDILIHYFKTLHDETTLAVAEILSSNESFKVKVRAVIEENLNLLKKSEGITKDLINTTSNLSHPLSPFGKELQNCQEGAIAMFKTALKEHSKSDDYLNAVAFMYWFYYLGVCLCWANDSSPNSKNTKKLIDLTYPLTLKLISITKLGVGKKLIINISNLLKSILLKWS